MRTFVTGQTDGTGQTEAILKDQTVGPKREIIWYHNTKMHFYVIWIVLSPIGHVPAGTSNSITRCPVKVTDK